MFEQQNPLNSSTDKESTDSKDSKDCKDKVSDSELKSMPLSRLQHKQQSVQPMNECQCIHHSMYNTLR